MATERHTITVDVDAWRKLQVFRKDINGPRVDAGKSEVSLSRIITRAITEFVDRGQWDEAVGKEHVQ